MFKIGDKVRLVDEPGGLRGKGVIGKVVTIIDVDATNIPYKIDVPGFGDAWCSSYKITSLELKIGDRVIANSFAPEGYSICGNGVICEVIQIEPMRIKVVVPNTRGITDFERSTEPQYWDLIKKEEEKEMEFDKLELKEDLELEIEFEKGVELPREEVATRLQNVVDFVVKENIDARVRVDDDCEVWVHFSTDYSRQDETILDLLTGGKEIETPEQAKVRELKATIEKASKEVSELERSMK